MLQSIVGPPLNGPTDLKSLQKDNVGKDFKGSGSQENFGKTLEDRFSKTPKETRDFSKAETKPLSDDKKKEVAEAAAESPKKMKPGDVGKKTSQRQQAIKEFMDSIESEFQIPPTRLVEAMAELDDQQLAQSPEETAESFIAQLGLSKEDSDKAQALYAGLLTQLQQISTTPHAKVPEAGMTAGALQFQGMKDRVAAQQERQDVLNASLDRLTQSFWKNREGLEQASEGLPANEQFAADLTDSLDNQSALARPGAAALKELPPHLQGQMKEVASPALLAALAAQQAKAQAEAQNQAQSQSQDDIDADMASLKEDFKTTANTGALASTAPAAGAQKAAHAKSSAESFDFFSKSGQQGPTAMMKASQAGATEFKETVKTLESSLSELKDSLSGLEAGQSGAVKGEALKADSFNGLVPAANTTGTQGPTEAERQAAVQQVLKQAQFLVKKGGGEMNVQMSPEGMGTIHLKVMLQDGKVNVQMQAETHEAKKTIESSLAELKTSLAAQKLSMDNVKVDVVGQTSTDTATQNQTQSNGQGRDQTRQFWNQFNENFGSQGRRESLNEMPSLRSYGAKRDPLSAIDSASERRSTRSVEGKGSGLNLVA